MAEVVKKEVQREPGKVDARLLSFVIGGWFAFIVVGLAVLQALLRGTSATQPPA
jgi:hypothetical protein